MTRRLGKTNLGAAALALCVALAAGSDSAVEATGTNVQNSVLAAEACKTVIVKVHRKHWLRVRKTRKVHGHRVVVRLHGKIVYVHVYANYLKTERRRVCTAQTLAPMTPAPKAKPTTAPLRRR